VRVCEAVRTEAGESDIGVYVITVCGDIGVWCVCLKLCALKPANLISVCMDACSGDALLYLFE